MDTRFLTHNRHLEDPSHFSELDSDLSQLSSQNLIYQFPLLKQLPVNEPGIYTLSGGHRLGKTTLLKKWIEELLAKGISEKMIAFFPADLISNYHELNSLIKKQISVMPTDGVLYLIIDNIMTIRDWEKGITPLIDTGLFEHVVLMLSGINVNLSAETNTIKQINFRLNALSFRETVLLKYETTPPLNVLFEEFNLYLLHGGYLNAINELDTHGNILDKSLASYGDWICKEVVRQGKQERYLREILQAIIKHYNEQVTWNALAKELTIDHPKTIGDYFALLETMDVVFVQYALLEETLQPAPKKARKLMFTNPFIFHAIQAWLTPTKIQSQIKSTLDNPELCSKLVETCVITQFHRYYPTYYIKAEGEVDLAYVHNQRFWPIETTWTSRIRAKDLKQILKYSNGRILTKTERSGIIEHIKTEPLPLALWQLEDTDT